MDERIARRRYHDNDEVCSSRYQPVCLCTYVVGKNGAVVAKKFDCLDVGIIGRSESSYRRRVRESAEVVLRGIQRGKNELKAM